MRSRNALATVNVLLKVLLVAMLFYAVARDDLPQFQDKAMPARAVIYPAVALLVPLLWFWRGRGRRSYPHIIDISVVLPFFLDTAGNAANLYDRVAWFDDALHFANWVPLVAAFGLLLRYLRLPLGKLNIAALTVGFGAVTHILWEIGEYFAFTTQNKSELVGIYKDTIGDLGLSLSGSVVGGIAVATLLWNAIPTSDGSQRSPKAQE